MNKELKEKWLEALQSGEYKQASGKIKEITLDGEVGHCCLGVLLEIHPDYEIIDFEEADGSESGRARTIEGDHVDWGQACIKILADVPDITEEEYSLYSTNRDKLNKLWKRNDRSFDPDNPDYRNVIPLIKEIV